MDPITLAAGITAVSGLIGGERANKMGRKEATKGRMFSERMRNTQWQAGIADMEAAGINPALAYSQGPAASPGGNMASQMDAVSPAISSGMQMKRLAADLELNRAQVAKTKAEERGAQAVALQNEARLASYGISRRNGRLHLQVPDGQEMPLMTREIMANVNRVEQQARRERFTGDIAMPLADLSKRLGEILPILGLIGGGVGVASNVLRAGAALRKPLTRLPRRR